MTCFEQEFLFYFAFIAGIGTGAALGMGFILWRYGWDFGGGSK